MQRLAAIRPCVSSPLFPEYPERRTTIRVIDDGRIQFQPVREAEVEAGVADRQTFYRLIHRLRDFRCDIAALGCIRDVGRQREERLTTFDRIQAIEHAGGRFAGSYGVLQAAILDERCHPARAVQAEQETALSCDRIRHTLASDSRSEFADVLRIIGVENSLHAPEIRRVELTSLWSLSVHLPSATDLRLSGVARDAKW
jgi:hypothetical protein